jgi:ADP-ribose pyrophosphatase
VRHIGPYRVLSSKAIYSNPWISVREDHVLRPDDGTASFGIVDMKAGSTVLAIDRNSEVLLAREFKYAVERESLELISGGIETGESPLEAGKRELKEEAGLEAAEWVDMGVVDPFTTAIRSANHIFLARDLTEVPRHLDPGEMLDIVRVPLSQAVQMVMSSEITHAPSCTLLLKAEKYLSRLAAEP